ncbi:protein DGCR14, partial [Phenoliferia sp. Uapishka_3]
MSYASTSATPYGDSPHGSDWSTASNAVGGSAQSHRQLARQSNSQQQPTLSLLKQQVLTEDEYTQGVSDIIKRTFFPQLRELDAHNDLVQAYQSEDPIAIEESVRKMREICTPTPRRRNRGATPGRTPFGTESSDTPTYFGETPSSRATPSSRRRRTNEPALRYDPTLSLDAFQAQYTSEDNSSFAELLAKDNVARKEKYRWAWEAERRANIKTIRGREARERLVDVTRQMVENDPDGVVRMIQGDPGRPGDRKLVVEGNVTGGALKGRLMVEGKRDEGGKLMITDGSGNSAFSGAGAGEGGEVGYIDWDKPTVEEEEDSKEVPDEETQVPMEGSIFKNRNSLMFPPDADGSVQHLIVPDPELDGLPLGEPKGIRYNATRLDHIERAAPGAPSPSRSRINAAITGTPCSLPLPSPSSHH